MKGFKFFERYFTIISPCSSSLSDYLKINSIKVSKKVSGLEILQSVREYGDAIKYSLNKYGTVDLKTKLYTIINKKTIDAHQDIAVYVMCILQEP